MGARAGGRDDLVAPAVVMSSPGGAARGLAGAALRFGAVALAASLVLVLVALPAWTMHGQTHPDRAPIADSPALHGLAFEPIEFPSPVDGTTLRGWLLPAPESIGVTVVIAPGVSDNRQASGVALGIAPALLADGYDLLAFDFRAEGESDGDTLSFGAREQDDVLGAVAFARGRGARSVAVLGLSLGAASAILAAARSDEIDAVIADSAFAALPPILSARMRAAFGVPDALVGYGLALYGLTSGTDPASVRPVDAIARMRQPVLLVAGTADTLVPSSDSLELARAAGTRASTWIVPGAPHVGSYAAEPAAYTERVRDFLRAIPGVGG